MSGQVNMVICPLSKTAAILEVDNPRIDQRRGNGADDEITRRTFEGDGQEDQLDGGS
jgi:hypothetical protein